MSFTLQTSIAVDSDKLLFLDSNLLDQVYLTLKEDDGSFDGKELNQIQLSDDDLKHLQKMIKVILQHRDERI
tara:strand:+ start:2402 stop:2617 length:216 start_codon:yes stop_codon:yes gene_type:complete